MRTRLGITSRPQISPRLNTTSAQTQQARPSQSTQQQQAQRQSQQLRFSPQQQQAVRLLQLSSLALETEINQLAADNPFLELVTPDADDSASETRTAPPITPPPDTVYPLRRFSSAYIPQTAPQSNDSKGSALDRDFSPGVSPAATQLRQHLLEQAAHSPLSTLQRQLVIWLIDQLDPRGYLPADAIDELSQSLPGDQARNRIVVERALKTLQGFEPTGVAARNLSECLLLQLAQTDGNSALKPLARRIIQQHLKLLAGNDVRRLHRALLDAGENVELALVETACTYIRSLRPHPISQLEQEEETEVDYVQPDFVLIRSNTDSDDQNTAHPRWRIQLNPAAQPHVQLDEQLHRQIVNAANPTQRKPLEKHFHQAKWLVSQLARRHTTLLRVADTIVLQQQAYFDHGPRALAPLTIDVIADALSLHTSTISRSIQDKYVLLPPALGAQIIPLKMLFSKALPRANGEQISATAIGEVIRQLIQNEPPQRPLSDQKLTNLVREQGIDVARRTVSKYRERLNIPASPQRKARRKLVST